MTDVTYRAFNLDTGAFIADLVDFATIKADFQYSAVGGFICDHPLTGRFASLLDTDIEIVAYYNGVEIRNARWVVRGKSGDATNDDGGSITLSGLSLLDLLRKVILYTDTAFNASTPGGIIKALLTTATTRGAFGATAITTSTFTNTTDSKGVAWANTLTITYQRGATYRQIIESLISRGLIDIEFNGRDLMVYNGTTMGSNVDLTLAAGRHVLETPYKISTEERANIVLVEGDNGVTAERTTTGPRREESFTQQSGVTNTPTLNVIGDLMLGTSAIVADQRTVKVARASTIKPLRDFKVGDFIFYDDGRNPVESMRVRQITLEANTDGSEDYSLTLNDLILESDIKRAIQLGAIAGGVGGGTTGSTTDPTVTDTTIPSAPASVTQSTATYLETDGTVYGQLTVSWSAVTTNTDASTITDLQQYEVQYQSTTAFLTLPANQWTQSNVIPAGTTAAYFGPVRPGSSVTSRVRAVDNSGHASAWTSSTATTVVADTTPPPPPSTPQVAAFFRGIRIVWDGLDNAAGAMPGDFDHLDIHVSTVSGFTPSTATWVDALKTRGGVSPILNLTYGTTYFVKLIAYDTTGNASTPSAQASAAPSQLSDPDLPLNLVTGAKIATQTIAVKNLTVGAFAENDVPNGSMGDISANNRPSFWENVGTVVGGGSLSIMSTDTTSQINGTNSMKVVPTATVAAEFLSANMEVTETDIYYVSTFMKTSRVLAGGGTVKLMAYTGVTAGARTTTFTVAQNSGSTSVAQLEGQIVVPAGHRYVCIGLYATVDSVGAYNAFFADVEMRKVIGTANLANASVNNAKIANLAVDNAKISDLDVGKLTTGTLAADIILGARIRTASSGARVDISGIGIEMYRASGFRTGYWNVSNGQMRIYNETDASLTSTGHGLQFGDDAGLNMIIDNNEIMVRNNGATDNMSLNQYGGSVGMSSTLYPGNPYSINAMRVHPTKIYITNPVTIYAGDASTSDYNDVNVLNEDPPLMIGINSAFHVQYDNNELQAVFADSVSDFGINRQGGDINLHKNSQINDFGSLPWIRWRPRISTSLSHDISIIMGGTTVFIRDYGSNNPRDLNCRTLTQTSSRMSKTDIVDISGSDVLGALADIPVYSYKFLDDPIAPIGNNTQKAVTPGPRQIGPMAEDLAAAYPDLVQDMPHVGLSINMGSMMGILFQAGKNLRQRIMNLTQRTAALEADVAAIKSKVGL